MNKNINKQQRRVNRQRGPSRLATNDDKNEKVARNDRVSMP